MRFSPRCRLVLFVSLAAVAASAACAPDSSIDTAGTQGSGGAGTAAGTSGIGGQLFPDAGPNDALPDPDAACGLLTEQATATPLHLYIVLDKSSTMAGTKWEAARAGLKLFANDPGSAGVRVGLTFMPYVEPATCDVNVYKNPAVPFGELPQNATAIGNAIDAEMPNGFSTPIWPALNGAILKGIEIASNNPGDAAAVLLVTDGQPLGPATLCSGQDPEDPNVLAAIAQGGATFNPPVSTFVIGLPGANNAVANQIAAAGGTDSAILISTANTQAEFADALSKVRGRALPCEYAIPDKVSGGEVDPGFVNVLYTPGGGQTATLPQNESCTGPGWHYDNAAMPTKIIFCPESCQTVKEDFNAQVQILLGCKTEIAK